MLELPELIAPMFAAAGWKRSDRPNVPAAALSGEDVASIIIAEFGGLTVGASGNRNTDIHFYTGLRAGVSFLARPWLERIGKVAAFALQPTTPTRSYSPARA